MGSRAWETDGVAAAAVWRDGYALQRAIAPRSNRGDPLPAQRTRLGCLKALNDEECSRRDADGTEAEGWLTVSRNGQGALWRADAGRHEIGQSPGVREHGVARKVRGVTDLHNIFNARRQRCRREAARLGRSAVAATPANHRTVKTLQRETIRRPARGLECFTEAILDRWARGVDHVIGGGGEQGAGRCGEVEGDTGKRRIRDQLRPVARLGLDCVAALCCLEAYGMASIVLPRLLRDFLEAQILY